MMPILHMRSAAGLALAVVLSLAALSATETLGIADGVVGETFSTIALKASRVSHDRHCQEPEALGCFVIRTDTALSVHPNFLLFDFKQNLRHWPNVAGDISRSPPAL